MERSALRIIRLLALLIAPLAVAAHADQSKDPFEAMAAVRPAAPTPAPDVVFRSLDGRAVRLSDLRGTPVLLGFFTTW
jgi:cytochrome oxidase Cu insertion factor (SCO1/SenC/PrrC family)